MHTARLKENGKEVVIKVIRPDIVPVIKADMSSSTVLPAGCRVCCRTAAVFARRKWFANTKKRCWMSSTCCVNQLTLSASPQLRREPMLYVPEVYSDYCSEGMMVMERIYGIPVSDVAALEAQGTNVNCWLSVAYTRSSLPRFSATASSMPTCIRAIFLSAVTTRRIRSTLALTAVSSAR